MVHAGEGGGDEIVFEHDTGDLVAILQIKRLARQASLERHYTSTCAKEGLSCGHDLTSSMPGHPEMTLHMFGEMTEHSKDETPTDQRLDLRLSGLAYSGKMNGFGAIEFNQNRLSRTPHCGPCDPSKDMGWLSWIPSKLFPQCGHHRNNSMMQ
ncbi:hypothetical protein PCH_Pc13g03860 [Penicillium rubens Wisconsin 54-1255]|uniref:Uncharacterized protein n=1 Tax=Penicillium rubens (strain ATCC 28089 / DSM 1075 / NRRL 1951 / Wisconsin 54-1255) TaxID=500485 RepID=B6H227_PENRW|nr:hypothetical protein PCH_Pc13g03860 [Penicillium rubens Wisconsin 54-1255]